MLLNSKLLQHLSAKRMSSRSCLLISCSVSDLLQAGIGYVTQIVLTNTNRASETWCGKCLTVAFVITFFGLASISHLTFMALDRSIHIGNPMLAMRMLNMRNGNWRIIIALVWVISFTAALLPFLGFGRFDTRSTSISCSVSWQSRNPSNMAYIYFLISVFFVIPVIIFVILLLHDIYRLRERRSAVKYLQSGQEKILVKRRRSTYKKKAHHYFRMVQLMIAVFILQWTPYVVNTLIIHTTSRKITFWLDLTANMIAKASTLSNPVIYLIWERKGIRILSGSLVSDTSTRSQISLKLLARKGNPCV